MNGLRQVPLAFEVRVADRAKRSFRDLATVELRASAYAGVLSGAARREVAGRGAEFYERSIDMLVARLRRKVERDARAPVLIGHGSCLEKAESALRAL